MHEARVVLQREQGRHAHRAVVTHPPQIVPHQIDDHEVLGLILRRQPRWLSRRALDRRRLHPPPFPHQEPLWRSRGDVDSVVGQPQHRGIRRRVPLRQRRPQRRNVRIRINQRRTQPPRQIHLINIPLPNHPPNPRHPSCEPAMVERADPGVCRDPLPGTAPPGTRRTDRVEAGACRFAVEANSHRPKPSGLQRPEVVGDIRQPRTKVMSHHGNRRHLHQISLVANW